jgi:hypothetical protein
MWMYYSFKTGAEYDMKKGNPAMEHVGNFNYGAMGRAAGIWSQSLKRAGGVYQKYGESISDIFNRKMPRGFGSTYKPEFGDPFDINLFKVTSYGDDPVDLYHVQKGMDWYENNY